MYRILLSIIAIFLASQLTAQNLAWIGDPSDFLPPADITIQYTDSNCTREFDMQPASGMCMWEGVPDGGVNQEAWIWEVLEDVHWQGGCDVEVFYSHVPCSDALNSPPIAGQMPRAELVESERNSVLTTEVCLTIRDNCDGSELQYCWNVTVQCGSCGETGNIYCETCEDAAVPLEDGGCKLCDPAELTIGYNSCTPPCADPTCPIMPSPPQPSLLCDEGGFVPHNISWFAFVASDESAELEVFIFNCIGGGIQSGIYPSCDFEEPCVGYNVNCSTNSTIDYDANFNVGQTYYMFIDGCNGAECEYEVTVKGLSQLIPDEIDHLTAHSLCQDEILTDDFSRGQTNASASGNCEAADIIYTCPGELIQFGVRHQGNVGAFPGFDNPCDEYPIFDANFLWSSSWGETWEYNPLTEDTGHFSPEIRMPDSMGTYTFCLDFIDYKCYPNYTPKCIQIEVTSGITQAYYEDADNDGYGIGDPVLMTCPVPAGYTCVPGDCDDSNATVGVVMPTPEIDIDCSVSTNNVVVYSWDEMPGLDYEVDLSLMSSNLIVTASNSSRYTVTGFSSSCQYAILTVNVRNEFSDCGAISETLPCRPSVTPNILIATENNQTSFSECGQHDQVEVIARVNGLVNSALGSWETVSSPQSSEGFIFNGSTLSFDPNGLAVGEYSANYIWTNPVDGCTTLYTYSLFVTECVPVDNDQDGVFSDTDCDDSDPNNYPGNTEICDGQDNNCDGQVDEGVVLESAIITCADVGLDFVQFEWSFVPGAVGYNLSVTAPASGTTEYSNNTETSFVIVGLNVSEEVTICVTPVAAGACAETTCLSCTTSDCEAFPPVSFNSCDELPTAITFSWDPIVGIDNYLVTVNNASILTTNQTFSVSGLLPSESVTLSVQPIHPTPGCTIAPSQITCVTPLAAVDNDGDGVPQENDCDDNDPNNFPGNLEICDGQDNNCDGVVDEGFSNAGLVVSCISTTNTTIVLGWPELLDAQVYYVFVDNTYVGPTNTNTYTLDELVPNQNYSIRVEVVFTNGCPTQSSVTSCQTMPDVDIDGDGYFSFDDCDDNDPNNYPGNTEICDNRDNNCNGEIDEGLDFQTYYLDNDRDGFGDEDSAFEACITPPNVTTIGGDCDDFNNTIFPGATEIPDNGVDENCDGEDGSTAVHELGGYTISVYPNPVTEFLHIDTALNGLSYSIFNLEGSLVKEGKLAQRLINLSDFSNGTYMLVLKDTKGAQVVDRIVKL